MDIIVKVKEIKGYCPVYQIGDTFKLEDGFKLISDKPLCMHSLASLLPHYNALLVSDPEKWGLAGKEDKSKAYIQCLDPLGYTDGGTVIFEISKNP
ncbi:MAG: TIGR04076 family protein [Candidatus Helarchaeota archaeon]